MRVVQVSGFRDARLRDGEAMLEAWTALTCMGRASGEAGFETLVVQAGWRDQQIERDGVRYLFVDEARGVPWRVPALVARLRPRVVHYQGLNSPQTALLPRRGRAVLVQHHSEAPRQGWRRSAQRWWLWRISGALFTSRELAEPFFAARVLPRRLPIYEALESTSSFTPGDQAQARAATGIAGDPCVLWLGRLDHNKDPLTTLEAVSQAASVLPGIRLIMCYGNTLLLPEVEARLAAEPALAARVELRGRVPHAEVERLLRAADFFVQGSRREAGSYSILEALACGVTPLVSDIPAFRWMLRGEVGGHFPRGDAAALARLLVRFAARPRDMLRAVARAHFERHLSPAAISRSLSEAYLDAAGAA
jgi:glycosyltransferase involved in cell wall biosynthesis